MCVPMYIFKAFLFYFKIDYHRKFSEPFMKRLQFVRFSFLYIFNAVQDNCVCYNFLPLELKKHG